MTRERVAAGPDIPVVVGEAAAGSRPTEQAEALGPPGSETERPNRNRGYMTTQPQFIVTAPDGTEILLSFWGGVTEPPEAAPRIDHTRWGAPLPVVAVTS